MTHSKGNDKSTVRGAGRSLDAMIWLSGGFFVTTLTLLFLFVFHIVYHSVQAHWPKRIALLQKVDGTISGGEIHHHSYESQNGGPVNILLKQGNPTIGGQAFTTIPVQDLVDSPPIYPSEILALEMRDTDPIFGLVNRMTQLQHSLLANVAVARVFLTELNSAFSKGIVDSNQRNAFEERLPADLESMIAQANDPIEIPIEKWDESLSSFQQIVARNAESIRLKQLELSTIDEELSETRKVGLKYGHSQTKSFSTAIDEVLRLAFEVGAAEQAVYELEASRKFWMDQYQNDESILKGIGDSFERLKSNLLAQQMRLSEELEQGIRKDSSLVETDSVGKREEILNVLLETAQTAKAAYAKQLRINTELAELDLIRKAFRIELAVLVCLPPSQNQGVVDAAESGLVGLKSNRNQQSLNYYWRPMVADSSQLYELATRQILFSDVVRLYAPNQMGLFGKLRLFIERWFEFFASTPRRGGLAGGVFPAIWGTIVMTILMSIMVMPFGVMAAIYMREYAQQGWMLSIVRVIVNNLAGVPSIVYGVFGLAFFSYLIGGYIDGGPKKIGLEPMPIVSWSAMVAVSVASTLWLTFRTLSQGNKNLKPRMAAADRFFSLTLLFVAISASFLVIAKVPFFDGLYNDELPNPTFGKGCLLWASFTMALLTLPIVIVTTEEALGAVPASLKEGSYACGATKWQTIERLILPYARPGIITGMILSIARGAGEVAPLMLVGAIPLTSDLPLDWDAPFMHGSRSFMHLGYHIYSLGLQNPDVNSARPMVYATIVLLMLIVFVLNSIAIWLRNRVNKKIKTSHF